MDSHWRVWKKGQFFAFNATAGNHDCRLDGSASSKDNLSFALAPSNTLFVRYEKGFVGTASLKLVEQAVADNDWDDLNPIEKDAIKNPAVAGTPLQPERKKK